MTYQIAPSRCRRARWKVALRLGVTLLLAVAPLLTVAPQPAEAATTVTVTDHGVHNDGSDSTYALRQLLSSTAAPRTLVFPAGTYRFKDISLPSDTTLEFASGAYVKPPYGSSGGNFLTASGTSRIAVKGGSFDGENVVHTAVGVSSASYVTVSGAHISRFVGSGLSASGSSNVSIADSDISYVVYGVLFSGSSSSSVIRTSLHDLGRDGVLIYSGSDRIAVRDSLVEKWPTSGEHGRAGIHAYDVSNVTVTGSTVRNGLSDAEGIRFRNTEGFWAEGNTVSGTVGTGIAVVYISDYSPRFVGGNGTILRNTVTGTKLRGIGVPYTQLNPVRIVDNKVSSISSNQPYDAGVGIMAYAPGSTVVGNEVSGTTGEGIVTNGSRVLVTGNTVSSAGSGSLGTLAGITVWGSEHTVTNNTIANTGSSGVYIAGSGSAVVERNEVSGAPSGALITAGTRLSTIYGDYDGPTVDSDAQASYADAATIDVTAYDAGSGAAAIRYSLDGAAVRTLPGPQAAIPVTGTGSHTLAYWAVDLAGNWGPAQSKAFTIGSDPAPEPEPEPAPEPPASPTDLTASIVNGMVKLTWTPPTGEVTSQRVERSPADESQWSAIATVGATDSTYTDAAVTAGNSYAYRIVATNEAGDSTPSGTAGVTVPLVDESTDPAPDDGATPTEPALELSAPSDLSVQVKAWWKAGITLTWTDNSTGEDGFIIERAVDDGSSPQWSVAGKTDAGVTSFTERVATGRYLYRVRAFAETSSGPVYSPYSEIVVADAVKDVPGWLRNRKL